MGACGGVRSPRSWRGRKPGNSTQAAGSTASRYGGGSSSASSAASATASGRSAAASGCRGRRLPRLRVARSSSDPSGSMYSTRWEPSHLL
eukprot:5409633-Prymnesium_polylepis.3